MFLGRDKGWWQEKFFLFIFLLIGGFVISPNGARKATMCGLGFTSYCDPEFLPKKSPLETMEIGDVRWVDGVKITRTK